MLRTVIIAIGFAAAGLWLSGCGTTKSRVATEQLLMSDAVDRSIANIDFRPLSGESVYLDTKYLQMVKGNSLVNADYVISSLRQQMMAADCRLEEKLEDAEFVAEARMGALGTDGHEVTYGIPSNRGLSSAASLLPNAPPIPAIPEISLAKKDDEVGAAKIAVFAYHRTTGKPIWQSGLSQARSSSKNLWLFGAGPFQRGTIYDRTGFAGDDVDLPLLGKERRPGPDPLTLYSREVHFVGPRERLVKEGDTGVQLTTFQEQAAGPAAAKEQTEKPAAEPPAAEKPAAEPPATEKSETAEPVTAPSTEPATDSPPPGDSRAPGG
jgi:hypothetical protein